MMVDFEKIGEIAFLVSMGKIVILDNSVMVNEFNYDEFVRNNFDA